MTDDPTPQQTGSGAGHEPDVIGTRRGLFGASGSGDTSGYGRLVAPITFPGDSSRPYGGYFDEIADELAAGLQRRGIAYGDAVEKVVIHHGDMTVHIAREHLVVVAATLRDEPSLRFELCLGCSGVHYPDQTGRELHAVYPLRSLTHNRSVLLDVSAPDADPHIPSLYRVYPTDDWHEREAYDFFGIVFDGHPSLTRIQMPDDWEGHPQRKDYPLGGVPVEYKGTTIAPPDQRRSYN
ncbi:NADH-quinone oxidoreductase subunit C [Gordonia zhaorongruii]|uniref:NADH-quinone oxidoreductase subunit C n=1 Tax=Gordonia zhaorongruii TaxID=2597659 RepID=UPI00104D27EF|nr:NADH-quinone oxidoreductase subunit C [Gordonia zhaorongruii]